MNKKTIRSFLAVLLTLIIMVGALPLSVFVDDIDDGSSAPLPDVLYEDITEPFSEGSEENSAAQDDDSAAPLPDGTYEDSNEPPSDETEEDGAAHDDDSDTSSPDGIFGSGIEIPSEEEKDNKYPILPMAAITNIIDPSYRIVGFDVHGSGSDTTYTVKGGTWTYDGGSNALFCSEWDDIAPNDNAKIQFYGLMEENESGLSFSALWAYKCIKGAKGIWNDSAYSALTERMKLFAINRAMLQENEGHYYTSYRTPVAGGRADDEDDRRDLRRSESIKRNSADSNKRRNQGNLGQF